MSRLMSVSLTEDAVRARRKRQTRRLGWKFVRGGERVTLCRKVMGRRRADGAVEPLVRICDVDVVSVRHERLSAITPEDVEAEGFTTSDWGDQDPCEWFIGFFTKAMRCHRDTVVTVIEWRYVDDAGLEQQ